MESKDIQNSILKAVDTIATRRVSQLELDKTITAIIKNNVGIVNRRKIYRVQYDGGFFNATAQNEGDAYLPGMAVYVSIPQGNFSNEKFIIGRANSFATNEQVSAVAALANNYGIVGANNIKGSSTQSFGVHSYHNPKEEESAPEKIAHRYNLLYKYGEDDSSLSTNPIDAKLYAKDTNAIMFRADFMNILSSEQKAKVSGEFGVVFNLAFKNKAYEIGETQGEILDHYADIIQAEIPNPIETIVALEEENENNEVVKDTDNHTVLKTLRQYIEDIVSIINQEDEGYFENTVALDFGFLDQKANDILILVGKFAKENPAAYDDIAESIVNAYVTLIEDLRTVCKSFEEMQEEYKIWRETKIKEPEEKIVSYYLSSNSMIGNPFHFSSWISQYEVFEIDLESFLRLDSIILYKEGFIQDASKEANWPLPTPIQEEKGIQQAGPDIFVRNLQMYFMKPLTDYDGTYQLKVESPKQGFIFYGDEAEDYEIKLTATVFRELYEDLSRNQNTKFYWFKSDGNIVSPNQSEYSPYGGLGWAEIPNNNSYKIKIGADSCPAYENYFRCVAVYTGEETPIILRYDVVLYNMKGQQFALESDLGDHFGFDAGNPVLTLKTRTDQEAEFEEIVDSENQFKFYWYLITNNAQKVFLLENTTTVDYTDINIANFAQNKAQAKLLNNIEFYQGENKLSKKENYSKATRIKYPMSNAGDASNLTFEVYIENTKNNVTVGKASLVISNLENGTISDYRLYIENGEQVFQYDEYGNPPNSKKLKDPLVVLPIKAKLFNPRNIEITDTNFRTRWFFPIEESMIQYSTTQAKNDPTTGRARIFEGSEISFEIADKYNPSAIDNNILCEVTLGEKTFLGTTNFLFTKVGENGTNGTDMVAKIEPVSDNPILDEQPVTIYTQPKTISGESDEEDIITKESTFNFENNWQDELNINIAENKIGALKVRLFQKSQEVDLNNAKRIRWNIAGNTSTGTNKNGRYIVINNSDLVWSNNPKYNLPQKLFQSVVKAEIQYSDDETYYAFYTLPYIEYENKAPLLRKNRIGIKNSSYLKEIVYNSDGRNPIYNHNQGLELLNIPEDCYIEWTACGGMTAEDKWIHVWKQKTAPEREESEENTTEENASNTETTTQTDASQEDTSSEEKTPTEQDISDGFTPDDEGFLPPYSEDWKDLWMKVYVKETEYYEDENARPTFKLLTEKDGDKKTADLKIIPKEVYNEEGEIINIVYPENKVYVLPDDSISGNITNNYIKAAIKKKDGSDIVATVYAPISFSLNTFGLASVNAWDGNSITLDDENGAILAPQVAAGKKNDNNQFTGVVMGVTNDYSANEAEHLTGLFGYSGGLRSFFLDSETGRATFGLPNTKAYENDVNGNKTPISKYNRVKHWDEKNQKYEEIEDYNEGQIVLDPAGESVIGGWRLGRHSLYYTESGQIGEKYKDEWAKHHEKDIEHGEQGVLISADPSYISIKGRVLNSADIKTDNEDNQVEEGDSLELQLDPKNLTMFGIFRHHKDDKWDRQLLSGINRKGQLVANKMEQVPANSQQTSTSLGIENLNAFGKDNYVGLNLEAGQGLENTIPFFRAFVNKEEMKGGDKYNTPVYITGGQNLSKDNDYNRPISIHGKEISLHSSNSSKLKGTDSEFVLKDGELSAKLSQTSIKFSKSTSDGQENNVITTAGNLHINVGTAGKPFFLNTSSQTILAKGVYNFTSTTGGINITSNGTNDIKIKKEIDSGNKSIIQMSANSIHSTIAENSSEKAYLKLNKTSASQLKTPENLEIKSDKRVLTTGYGSRSASQAEGLDFGDFYGILLRATSGDNDESKIDDVMLGLGPYNPVRGGSDNVYSTPFYVNAGLNVGQIYIAHTTYSNVTEPAWTRFCVNGMDEEISGGLKVAGNHHGSENGIYSRWNMKIEDGGLRVQGTIVNSFTVNGNNEPVPNSRERHDNTYDIGILANKCIKTNEYFIGNGETLSHTADWNARPFSTSGSPGFGGSFSFDVSDVSSNNGRPNIGTQTVTINMPSQSAVWDAVKDLIWEHIKTNVWPEVQSHLQVYLHGQDGTGGVLKDYIKFLKVGRTGSDIYMNWQDGTGYYWTNTLSVLDNK